MPSMALYEVGGCIRDEILGIASKDIDFSVEVAGLGSGKNGPEAVQRAYQYMADTLKERGYEVFVEHPDKATLRAKFPKGHPLRTISSADFVLCRQEGPYLDGRHPSYVKVGTLYDDLARRDFSVNAMARSISDDGERGEIFDPFGGQSDCGIKRLRFVGEPMDRLREDGLRALRAIRFKITKGFEWDVETRAAVISPEVADLLAGVSEDRRREELERCFHHDTIGTLDVLCHDLPYETLQAIFAGKLRLSATQKKDMVHANGKVGK